MSLITALMTNTRRAREVSVSISMHKDGYRSVSIHGVGAEQVAALMVSALERLNISAANVSAEPLPAADAPLLTEW